MNVFKTILLTTALLAVAPLAGAAVATDPMTVSITIQNSCTVTADDLSFNTQTTLAADIDVGTTVSVACTSAGPIAVGFNTGTGAGATFDSRKMTGPALIDYSLFRDAARTEVLGDGTGTTFRIGATSTGVAQAFNVYGRVFAGQNPKPVGSYSDTIVATVEF